MQRLDELASHAVLVCSGLVVLVWCAQVCLVNEL